MATRKFSYNNVQLTEFAYNHNDAIAFPLEGHPAVTTREAAMNCFFMTPR